MIIKLKTKKPINRLVNWSCVTRIDRTDTGIMIFFVDGSKVKDDRTMEEATKLAVKYWSRK